MNGNAVAARAGARNGIIALLVGAVLVLVAQFPLDPLADANESWHMVQHGTFFIGGVCVGVGLTLLFHAGQRRL